MSDFVSYEKDPERHIARITLLRPEKLNAMLTSMYDAVSAGLADAADDDDIKVVLLRGSGGVWSAGQDLGEVYDWYAEKPKPGAPPVAPDAKRRRPSQRRRLVVDRWTSRVYYELHSHPKATICAVEKYAFGAGIEMMMSCDMCVVGHSTQIGMPAARLLGPALGQLHIFFSRLGPVLAKDILLTGRKVPAAEVAHLGIFTRFVPDDEVQHTAEDLAATVARMPADGIVIAKEAYNLVERSMGMGMADVTSYMTHAFATNLRFEPEEFNFVKNRESEGLSKSFDQRDEHFERRGA